MPLDGRMFRRANYAWSTSGFGRIEQSRYLTAVRSVKSRRLAAQGAARQRNLLATYRTLAESYGQRLSHEAIHVVVQQNLLPFLWETGQLGGRTFDVLMTALPMANLQERLDYAKVLHPESTTLGDFRADPRLVDSESAALSEARRIITPHSEIASFFGERSVHLDWKVPTPLERRNDGGKKPNILFPSSTVGRKGCYELREAIAGLDVKLLTLGPDIEGAGFWDGFEVERIGADRVGIADIVVLPAFVEHKPRLLLRAAASGIPVIANAACGLDVVRGIETLVPGDPDALRSAIVRTLSGTQANISVPKSN